MQDLYSKFKINTSPDRIRLLHLLPATPEEDVECELILASLIEHPRYEAVSYVWGDATKTLNISIGGTKKAVTTNLHSFLRSRRTSQNPLTFWIDAICINQDDVIEKNQQVSIMKQIYSQADSLSIWLGPSRDDTELAFFTLNNLVDNAFWRIYRDGKLEAVLDILNRSWWERVWVIQELVAFGLSSTTERSPVIRCGSHEMNWSDLSVAAQNMIETDPKYGMPVQQARKIQSMSQEKAAFSASSGREELALNRLLKRYRRWKSTDPRDKIYALLGIAHSASAPSETIKPDYSRSVIEVFKQIAAQDILKSKNLTILSHVQGCELTGLPSWVPDWTIPLTAPTLLSDQDDQWFDTEYGEMEHSVELGAAGTFPPQISFSKDLESLCATGLHIDKVIRVSKLFPPQFREAELDDLDSRVRHIYWATYMANLIALAHAQEDFASYRHEDDPYTDINSRKYAFWTAVFGGRIAVESITGTRAGEANYLTWLPRAPAHWTAKMPSGRSVPKDLALEYRQVLEHLGAEGFDLCTGPIDFPTFLDVFLHYRNSEWQEGWSLRTLKYIYNRRLYLTRMGYIGVGPADTSVGDCVVVLFGGDVPFILRPRGGGGEEYEFIGESYVWGLMDGEAVQGLSSDDPEAKTFRIS